VREHPLGKLLRRHELAALDRICVVTGQKRERFASDFLMRSTEKFQNFILELGACHHTYSPTPK
jgi:hypothetical protein